MAEWVLSLAGHQLTCGVPFRKADLVRIELREPVTIKPGRWGMLIAPGGKTRFVVEVGLPKSPRLIECQLLGVFAPSPNVCLECGAVLKDNEVVRRIPGMEKKAARELCLRCWEAEAARKLRPGVDELAHGEDHSPALLFEREDGYYPPGEGSEQ